MTPADVDAVIAIATASPEASAWNRESYETMLANPERGCCRVAEQDGMVVGFLCFRVVEQEAEVLNLAVLPSFWRQGIGSELVKRALQETAEKGARHIFLEVRESNGTALRLYERLGFKACGRRPGYYANPPADALVLHRSLPLPRASG